MMFSVKAGGFYRSNSAHAGQLLYFYLKCKNVSIEDQLRQVKVCWNEKSFSVGSFVL